MFVFKTNCHKYLSFRSVHRHATCGSPGAGSQGHPVPGEQGGRGKGESGASPPTCPQRGRRSSAPLVHLAALSSAQEDGDKNVAFLQQWLRKDFGGHMEIPKNCSLFVQYQTKEFRDTRSPGGPWTGTDGPGPVATMARAAPGGSGGQPFLSGFTGSV